ncbi:MAG: PKD domain-containing protein [Dehalococcoidia bacterium]
MYRRVAVFAVALAAVFAAVGLGTGSAAAQTPAPVAVIGGPYSGAVGYPIQFSAAASTGLNLTFAWNFGDGTTGAGPIVAKVYTAPGTYTVVVTVSDGQARTSTAQTQVAVGANPGYVPGTNQCYYGGCGAPVVANYATYNPCNYSCVGSYYNYNPCNYSCVGSYYNYNYNPCNYSCVGSYYNYNYNPCNYSSCVGSYYNYGSNCGYSCARSYTYNPCNYSCVGSYYNTPTYHKPTVVAPHVPSYGGCATWSYTSRYNMTGCVPIYTY